MLLSFLPACPAILLTWARSWRAWMHFNLAQPSNYQATLGILAIIMHSIAGSAS